MLSQAEENIYKHLTQGLTNAEIADRVCVSEKTVKFHLTNIYQKLGFKNRGEAIAYAQHNQFLFTEKAKAEGEEMSDFRPVSEVVQE